MIETLEIGEVARRTGLSHRALRFYEARGLVTPLRLAGGRRVYGPGELARLNAVVALKQAGFSLAEIARTLTGRPADLRALVAAQIEDLDRKSGEIAAARALLASVKSRIDRGEPIDVATLCSLIRAGDTSMTQDSAWKPVIDRYFTPDQQTRWDEARTDAVTSPDYAEYWEALGTRIAAALSLPEGPPPEQAEAFVREWFTLLEPFTRMATPEMWNGAVRLYEGMTEWHGEGAGRPDPGFSPEVWTFIQDTAARMKAEGKPVGPLPAFMAEKG